MKKLMTIALGLGLVLGLATATFGQDKGAPAATGKKAPAKAKPTKAPAKAKPTKAAPKM